MWWVGLIELFLFFLIAGVVLWVFFAPTSAKRGVRKKK